MSKPANQCDQCIQFNYDLIGLPFERVDQLCAKGHRPRFYLPRNDNPHDPLWGWKRRCKDFEAYESRT